MRKKIIIAVAAVVLLCCTAALAVNGLDFLAFNSAENLVRPPKLSGIDGELQEAFEAAVEKKGEYILRYPTKGQYRSAYVRYDCDGDGNDEAFVFYSPKTEEMLVYMYMLNYSGSGWNAVGEVLGDGSDIYSVEFCDLNGDGISEVLVGWSSLDSKSNKKLSVYCSFKNSQSLNYKLLAIEAYTEMHTADLDEDGETEILLALIDSTSDTYKTEARLLKMMPDEKNGFQINAVGQTSLYSETASFMQITSGKSGDREYVYIDEAAGNLYLTEMLYWDSQKNALASAVKVDVLSVTSCPTSRSLDLVCTDIDGDGEIEIPGTALLADSSVVRQQEEAKEVLTASAENVYIVKWNKYDRGKFTVAAQYIENKDDYFKINYDPEKMKNWSVTFYPDTHLSQFSVLKESEDPGKPDESVLLFSVTAVKLDDTVSIGTYLMSGKTYKYIYEITDEGENAGITKQYITEIFSLTQ